jgi:hypothetical protein
MWAVSGLGVIQAEEHAAAASQWLAVLFSAGKRTVMAMYLHLEYEGIVSQW